MPRINMYVRNEDLIAYQAIEDKPAWLHNAIVGYNTLNVKLRYKKPKKDAQGIGK